MPFTTTTSTAGARTPPVIQRTTPHLSSSWTGLGLGDSETPPASLLLPGLDNRKHGSWELPSGSQPGQSKEPVGSHQTPREDIVQLLCPEGSGS